MDIQGTLSTPRRARGGINPAGPILIVVGLILLAQQFQWRPNLDMQHLWPLIPVTVGLTTALRHRDARAFGGLLSVFVGVIFLLHTYNIAPIRETWPLFVVAAGGYILLGSCAPSRLEKKEEREGERDHVG